MLLALDLNGGRVQEQGTVYVESDGTVVRDITAYYSEGARLMDGIGGLDVADVRGRGLFIGVELASRERAAQVKEGLKARGILISTDGPNGSTAMWKTPSTPSVARLTVSRSVTSPSRTVASAARLSRRTTSSRTTTSAAPRSSSRSTT